jgi:hypothetical protein
MSPELLPTLAVSARPFESQNYSLEAKLDGARALAALEASDWRLLGCQPPASRALPPVTSGATRQDRGDGCRLA